MEKAQESGVETLSGSWAPSDSRPIELVFRTVGERTSELSLEFALEHIKPQRAHVIRNVKPFRVAVQRMLAIDHRCSHVLYLDADCLILEDMRSFLDANDLPYVDCYGHDRFRGLINRGVHITRVDVVCAMRALPEPVGDLRYALFPESHLRNLALFQLGFRKQYKNFCILHDYFQWYSEIFAKNALCELRNRASFYDNAAFYEACFQASMSRWGDSIEFDVARRAVRHAASMVPPDAEPADVDRYIRNLPLVAQTEVEKLGLSQSNWVSIEEVEQAVAADLAGLDPRLAKPKVFGIGLSRTGTRSLTVALHTLGFDTVHYPIDRATLDTLTRGDARFSLLDHYDGITDITIVPYYKDLDRAWPGAKFVLTVREEESWLRSCRDHWAKGLMNHNGESDEHRLRGEIQRFIRVAVYGSEEFDEDRFRHAYRCHVDSVLRYFEGRERDLLILNIAAGDGYERLAPFLGVAAPGQPFPHRGKRLANELEDL